MFEIFHRLWRRISFAREVRKRDVFQGYSAAFFQQNGPFDSVGKFTGVSGPVVALEKFHYSRRKTAEISFQFTAGFLKKVVGKWLDASCLCLEGGQVHPQYIDPVIEVFSEHPGLDVGFKISMFVAAIIRMSVRWAGFPLAARSIFPPVPAAV